MEPSRGIPEETNSTRKSLVERESLVEATENESLVEATEIESLVEATENKTYMQLNILFIH